MRKSMILELADNPTRYKEKIDLFKIAKYKENYDKHYELCKKLCANLPDEEKRNFINEMFFAHGGMESVTADEYFKAGFKLGLIIGAQNFLD